GPGGAAAPPRNRPRAWRGGPSPPPAENPARPAPKVQAAINAQCTGPLPLLGPECNSATTNAQLAACITAPVQDPDVNNRNVDTLIGTVYDASALINDLGLPACQSAIGKAGGSYRITRMKVERTCEVKRGKGRVAFCPDAGAAAQLEKARVKLDHAIRLECTEAQLAANTAPKLDFGFPCEAYKLVSFV